MRFQEPGSLYRLAVCSWPADIRDLFAAGRDEARMTHVVLRREYDRWQVVAGGELLEEAPAFFPWEKPMPHPFFVALACEIEEEHRFAATMRALHNTIRGISREPKGA